MTAGFTEFHFLIAFTIITLSPFTVSMDQSS
jgi:hypothetical protein